MCIGSETIQTKGLMFHLTISLGIGRIVNGFSKPAMTLRNIPNNSEQIHALHRRLFHFLQNSRTANAVSAFLWAFAALVATSPPSHQMVIHSQILFIFISSFLHFVHTLFWRAHKCIVNKTYIQISLARRRTLRYCVAAASHDLNTEPVVLT